MITNHSYLVYYFRKIGVPHAGELAKAIEAMFTAPPDSIEARMSLASLVPSLEQETARMRRMHDALESIDAIITTFQSDPVTAGDLARMEMLLRIVMHKARQARGLDQDRDVETPPEARCGTPR